MCVTCDHGKEGGDEALTWMVARSGDAVDSAEIPRGEREGSLGGGPPQHPVQLD